MDSSATAATSTISAISKTLSHRRPTQSIIHSQLAFIRLSRTLTCSRFPHRSTGFNPTSYLRSFTAASAVVPPLWSRLGCVSSSAASYASFGGTGGGVGGNGGGGDGGDGSGGSSGAADGRDVRACAVPGGADDVSALSSDVIILDVGGMSCGGCAASVKRILESQPQVSSASVNLTTEMAIIWPISEAKVAPNWQKNLGDELAKHLTTCGFKSNPRGEAVNEEENLS